MHRTFISKMNNPEQSLSSEFTLKLPKPNQKEKTPSPRCGDIVLLWFNGVGLIGEGGVSELSSEEDVKLTKFIQYPYPLLSDNWLKSADRDGLTIQSRLRTATTSTGGTRLLSDKDLSDLDVARRAAVATELVCREL